ncbi:MAG: AMP-binding protein [Desulfomicrobium sp.]|nr:AMP-binding protein [Desulfomicrobium sp.]NLV95898.1 AMP-binding protein [Desulfovibrionales bacterium]
MITKLYPQTYEEFQASFTLEIPEKYNFAFDMVDTTAAKDPQRLAMVHVDDAGQRCEYTFQYFSEQSSRLANALQALSIGHGDKVMLILHRRVEFWTAMLALHKLGALGVPSPALLTAKDIDYRVNFASIKGMIIDTSVRNAVEEALPKCPSLSTLIMAGLDTKDGDWHSFDQIVARSNPTFPRPKDAPGGEDPATIFFSSGTTGQPKMVLHTFTYPFGHVITGSYWHDLEPGNLHLTLADTGWGKSLWGKLYGQWLAGGVVFVWDFRGKFEPAKLLQILEEHKITSFCAPPTVYRFLIREDLTKYDLSALKHCTTAGELLNESVFEAWQEKLGMPIYEGYGQTETTLQIATFPFMKPKAGSIGKPCPGWDVVLLDEKNEPCPPGVEGEICIRISPHRPVGLFSCYLQEEEKTKCAMSDGLYHTGDKAWMDEDGYFWFLGRVDDLIKSSGYRIGPFEVESALITHPAVVEAAVTGIPDPDRGQLVKATVTLATGYTPSMELTKALQDHVKKVTAPYKYPRIIEYVSELPKTISGKIKRAEIRAKDMEKA